MADGVFASQQPLAIGIDTNQDEAFAQYSIAGQQQLEEIHRGSRETQREP